MPETLRREANPPQGQFAAPLPQAWDPSILAFRKLTGELVQDHTDPDLRRFAMDVIPWAKVGSLWVPGQVNAQLSGSKVDISPSGVEGQIVPAGATYTTPWIDVSNYVGVWVWSAVSSLRQGKIYAEFGHSSRKPRIEGPMITLLDRSASGTLGNENYPRAVYTPIAAPSVRFRIENTDTVDFAITWFNVVGVRVNSGSARGDVA